ncbi:MAG: hypothetical protein Q8O30_08440 [Candidatus Omnitrophota bacterium]|nr:hypothetical protein [Candidatus Omnitrophota bacterium]
MEFSDLLSGGQLIKENTPKEKISEFLGFAENEIAAARFNLSKFPLTAYKAAYDALIHAGNALIRFYNYRPTSKFTHATITEFVDRILGKEYGHLARSFKRMRRKRHPLQYEAQFSESHKEVRDSIVKADELIRRIEEHIDIKPSQKRLF